VLSNADKRKIYDKYGKEGMQAGGGSTGSSFRGFDHGFSF